MSDIDHLALDGHSLRLFLAVLEEGSVTAAAGRLGLTQSAVSHNLQKLRRVLNDPLFVKSGRGIVATAHARALQQPARELLDQLRGFARGARFDPSEARLSLTVAANDFQRDLLLPALFGRLRRVVRDISLRVLPSDLPTVEILREGRADLLVSPFPPVGTDVFQKRLLTDRYVCFYDPAHREPPADQADYLAARHVSVVYPGNERLGFDRALEAAGLERHVAVSVPGFAGVAPFLRGSDMLATLPALFAPQMPAGFAQVLVPVDRPGGEDIVALHMYMAWHRRFQHDPAHAWLRDLLIRCAAEAARPV